MILPPEVTHATFGFFPVFFFAYIFGQRSTNNKDYSDAVVGPPPVPRHLVNMSALSVYNASL